VDDNRIVKSLLYSELSEGARSVGRPKLSYKDSYKSILKSGGVLQNWQEIVNDHFSWKRTIRQTCDIITKKE